MPSNTGGKFIPVHVLSCLQQVTVVWTLHLPLVAKKSERSRWRTRAGQMGENPPGTNVCPLKINLGNL